MNLLRLASLALTLTISASACNKNDDCFVAQEPATTGIAPGGCVVIDPCAEPCDGDVICTMDFRAVTVSVVNAAGNPLALDSFVVTDPAGTALPSVNGQRLYGILGDGRLMIINDGWMAGHQGMQMSVIAKGFQNGTLLFDQAYTIGADCCHVYKKEGPDQITVPN